MSAERQVAVTDADVRSLAAKLTGLHALLTPAEQEVLHTLLRRAAAAGTDLAGETGGSLWGVSFNPFTYLDAIDFGTSAQGTAHRPSKHRAPGTDPCDQPEGRDTTHAERGGRL